MTKVSVLSNLRISGCELKDNHYKSFILLFTTNFTAISPFHGLLSTNMAQMAHFSFPYYFTIPNSEFRIPKFALRISEFGIRNCEVFVYGQVVTANLL